jgi:hypothetical protein
MRKSLKILLIDSGIYSLYSLVKSIIKSPFFCRHRMIFYDMIWVVDPESKKFYDRCNGKIWKNSFCECQKCGVKKRMIMLPGRWGEWKNYYFETPKNGVVKVEIGDGTETKSQKRDRIINNLLKNDE